MRRGADMISDDLEGLRKSYLGFISARVILTANNLRIFDNLQRASSVTEISRKLKTDFRATEILLDALTGIGLTIKSRDGKYRNAPVSNRYLVKGSRVYQGDIVRHASTMWQNFSDLDNVVKTGGPAGRRGNDREAFILGMHNLAIFRTESLIKAIGLKGVTMALDLGGGPGTNAIAMAKKGVKVTIFDLPQTIAIAKRIARGEGAKGISFLAGDFHVDNIGTGYDLILVSQIFHAFSAEENIEILRKCEAALNRRGRVAVQEFPINEARTYPPRSALFSVNMLVGTEKGRCYTPQEMRDWLKKTGYKRIAIRNLPETVLIVGEKKG
jgi:2-polyprenyl-3-methyl-5-hydroxy-6-metoxy-1,4-benzoquinol methylase